MPEVYLVGNCMIDCLRRFEPKWRARPSAYEPGEKYAVLTVHRAENTRDRETMRKVFMAIEPVRQEIPIVFPVHPRTWKVLEGTEWITLDSVRFVEPLGYLDFCKLISEATVVLTDSGGVQEETTALGVPCLTLRTQTERPVTIEYGTNELVGLDTEKIRSCLEKILRGDWKTGRGPANWDGHAAERIVEIVIEKEATCKVPA